MRRGALRAVKASKRDQAWTSVQMDGWGMAERARRNTLRQFGHIKGKRSKELVKKV